MRKPSNNFAFVDKTMLIHEFLTKNKEAAVLVLRPRRFGKSLNISMLEYYLSILHNDSYEKLFGGTLIDKHKEIKNEHANQYPVIKIDFCSFDPKVCDSKEDLRSHFQGILLNLLNDYFEIIQKSDKLTVIDRQQLQNLVDGDQASVSVGLGILSTLLKRVFNKPCIILIDEYDNPIQRVFDNDERLTMLLETYSSFLTSGLKGNPSLAQAFVTGCTQIAQQQIFSGLNNLRINSLLSKDSFQEHYGFSEAEVKDFLDQTTDSKTEKPDLTEVKKYYNGYKVQVTPNQRVILMDIYNPYSISNFAGKRELKPYWVETAQHNMIVRSSYEKDYETTAGLFKVMECETVEKPIDSSISITHVANISEKIWTLLFHAGYLTLEGDPPTTTDKNGDEVYKLKIPNLEIKKAFNVLFERFRYLEMEKYKAPLNKSFMTNNLRLFAQTINSIMNSSNTSGHSFSSEDRYDSTIYWALWFHIRHKWDVFSQKVFDTKKRFDIIVVPREKCETRIGYIIKVKHLDITFANKPNVIESELQEAIEQIKDRTYYDYFLRDNSLTVEKLMYIGVVGCKSRIHIKSEEIDVKAIAKDQ